MKYSRLLWGFFIFFCPLKISEVLAQNPSETVTVGIYENQPKVFFNEDKKPSGFWVDIINEIGKQENWSIIYIPCEWSQCLSLVEQGKLDLMLDVAYSPERDRIFDFNHEVVLASWSQVYARRGLKLETILDLDGKKVGVLKDSIQGEAINKYIQSFGISPELVEIDSFDEIFVLLEKGDIDAGIINHFFGKIAQAKFNVEKTNILLNPARLHFIVGDKDPKSLLPKLNRQLQKLINNADSAYYQAKQKWLEPESKFSWLTVKNEIIDLVFYLPFIGLFFLLLRNFSLKKEVNHRIALEKKLKDSQQSYASLASSLPVGIFRTNNQFQCIYVNHHYTTLTGISFEDAIAGKWKNAFHPDDKESVLKLWEKSIKEKTIFEMECRFQHPDGKVVWVYAQSLPEYDSEGKLKGYVETLTDISDRKLAELALKESEQRFRNMAKNVPGAIFRYILYPDYTDKIIYMSDGCYELWEIKAEEITDSIKILWDLVHPEDIPAMQKSILRSAQTLQPWFWQWRITTPSGKKKWLEGFGRPTKLDDDTILWDSLIMDVSNRKQAEINLAKSEERLRLVTENMSDLICLFNAEKKLIYATPSCESLLGYTATELKEIDLEALFHPDDHNYIYDNCSVYSKDSDEDSRTITYRILSKSGDYIWLETLSKKIYDDQGNLLYIQTTSRDVSDRISMEVQLKHDALHDKLTGLPNRNLLIKRLDLALKRNRRYAQSNFALLFFDLDNFKLVNDSLGHLIGDELLLQIGTLLQTFIRDTDIAARLGGDEFVILLEDIKEVEQAVVVARRILDSMRSPFMVSNRQVFTNSSIGIVIGNHKHKTPQDVLRDADIAMYRAKHQGKGKYAIFDPHMHQQTVLRLNLENNLRKALEENQFVLYYQPIINLDKLTTEGFEVLIRWQHPQEGIVFPCDFIGVMEEIGLINDLGEWIFKTACQQLSQWQNQFNLPLKININLSVQQLTESIIPLLDKILDIYPIQQNTLVLEITESMLIKDFEGTNNLLSQIKQRSIQISIDDFGTGYSCLGYLHQLSVDALKIDRSFMNFSSSKNHNQVIVSSILALAQSLGIRAIAEGIETEEQRQWLISQKCKLGQGYLFSPPIAKDKATDWLNFQRLN
ncbi:EAL domain-containing protein [Cyanobacterium aponinum UTEX 3222]|uniref:EAL domain-containing protein n=1 Tax=Cyanobacterium aponinum TaxID=379064 RepID=UPI00308FB602|nr:EAL domain-containing protein [Cyanobacterium aponinum UTEX 3222]